MTNRSFNVAKGWVLRGKASKGGRENRGPQLILTCLLVPQLLNAHAKLWMNRSVCRCLAALVKIGAGYDEPVRRLLVGPRCMAGPAVITAWCWGCRWQPGGSTPVSCPLAGWCGSPPAEFWLTRSFLSCHSRLRDSPDWTRSSRRGPAGAVGSSPWSSNGKIFFFFNETNVCNKLC